MDIKNRGFSFQIRFVLIIVFVFSIGSFILSKALNNISQDLGEIESNRVMSIQLVDELRQSSDDLTQMARLYAITGDTTYLNHFNKVNAIRDGHSPRPIDYNQVYWDFLLAEGKKPRPDGDPIPLLELIQKYCSDEKVLEYFILAKENSDDLVNLEEEAFNAMSGNYKDSNGHYSIQGDPNKELAIDLLHSKKYFQGKIKIMESINDFYYFINNHYNTQVTACVNKQRTLEKLQLFVILAIIFLIAIFFLTLIQTRNKNYSTENSNYNSNFFSEIKNSWGLIFIGFVFSLLAYFFFNFVVNTIEKNIKVGIESSLSTVLESTQINIKNWLLDMETGMESLVQEKEIQNIFNDLGNSSNVNNNQDLSLKISNYFSKESVDGYVILDKNDLIVKTNINEWQTDNQTLFINNDFINSVKTGNAIEFSFPANEGSDKKYNHLIKIANPIYSSDSEYKGAIIVLLNPQKRFTNVLQSGRIGESGESYAFNDKGEMISESRFTEQLKVIGLLQEDEKSELNIEIRKPIDKDNKNNKGKELPFTFMASNALSGNAGVNVEGYNDYRGIKVIGVWTWVEEYSFGMTTEIDHAEAYATLVLVKKLSNYSLILFVLLIIILIVIFILNRTKLSRLNIEINKKSLLLNSMINSIPDLIFYKDINNKYLGGNIAFGKQIGKSIDSIIGKTDLEFMPVEEGNKFLEIDKKLLESKNPKPHSYENEVFDENKNPQIYETLKTPFFSENNELLGLIGISRDITDRKEYEKKILASENRFRSINSTATDGIVSVNKEGIIESWNRSAELIFGYTENDAIGKSLDIIIPEKYRDAHGKGFSRVLNGGEKKIIGNLVELEGLHMSGKVFPIEMALSNWDGEDGMHFSAILRDITERKRTEAIIIEANKRMEGELNVAKDIQMSMLPLIFPAFPQRDDLDVHAKLIPAREVGGDFYDFHFIDDNRIYFAVGDVSGKGVPAALMMAVTKTLLKSRANLDNSTASILTHANNEIAKDNDACMFITIFLGILNISTGELVYSNAGHNHSYIIKEDRSVKILSEMHGPVIGAMENMTFRESSIFVNKNDILFAYTDGVTEAQNVEGDFFTTQRLLDLLSKGKYDSLKSMTDLIIDNVTEFEDGTDQFDDITVLTLQYLYERKNVNTKTSSIQIKNEIKELNKVIDFFESFASENHMAFAITQKFNIVLDEILSNVISYGYEDDKSHKIDVEFKIENFKLVITIVDEGIPFNPFRNDPPDTMLSLDERNIGGLGIHLIKNLSDEYNYQRQADKNIITLIKYDINKK
ncbi:SpoIIE family protein phosphatase [Saprospiraceae bacterium]|nr:SpoIIE family protein phosphatase [Saprospiraceae bacterium]